MNQYLVHVSVVMVVHFVLLYYHYWFISVSHMFNLVNIKHHKASSKAGDGDGGDDE
jgi:hypothetical protein